MSEHLITLAIGDDIVWISELIAAVAGLIAGFFTNRHLTKRKDRDR